MKRKVVNFEDVHVGMELAPVHKVINTTQMFLFSAVTKNPHRIHYDEKYAHREGLPSVLVHGPLQGAQLAGYVTDWMGAEGFLKKFSYSNRGMALPNQPLVLKGVVKAKSVSGGSAVVELDVWEENEAGEVIVPATASVILPLSSSKNE